MDVVSACLFGFDTIIVPFFVGKQLPAAGLAEELAVPEKSAFNTFAALIADTVFVWTEDVVCKKRRNHVGSRFDCQAESFRIFLTESAKDVCAVANGKLAANPEALGFEKFYSFVDKGERSSPTNNFLMRKNDKRAFLGRLDMIALKTENVDAAEAPEMVAMLNNLWFEVEVAEMTNSFLNKLPVVELALKRGLRGRRCEDCGRAFFN